MTQSDILCTMRANLKLLRKTRNMTQEQVAVCIHVSRSAYAAYETGALLPSIVTLKKIADFHNMKIDDLINQHLSLRTINGLAQK